MFDFAEIDTLKIIGCNFSNIIEMECFISFAEIKECIIQDTCMDAIDFVEELLGSSKIERLKVDYLADYIGILDNLDIKILYIRKQEQEKFRIQLNELGYVACEETEDIETVMNTLEIEKVVISY